MTASAREVRKTVTILFCDLVHSTGLAEGIDPETYRRVQSRYFDEMRGVVERHGGTVEKFIGDEVMAVFGVPAVHEDDALRAVRAAREMLDRLKALNEELQPAWGVRLQARIGVNTGEVMAGDAAQGGSFVAGEPVIVAKRLEQAAGPGQILIGKTTFPLVEHAVKAGPLERIPVKGKHEDVGRRRVDEVDHAAPSLARRLDVPIVGREEELRLLHQAFEQAVDESSCRLFTVLGPAGIGKSRLARELASSLAGRATSAVGRCLPYGEGITFWPLTEILGAVGDEDALGEALGDERDVVLQMLRGATGASEAAGSSEETFWAVRRAFEALARQRPLVVCFEDLHWAEPTLLDLVEYVVGWSRDAPILVLCLARPELVERRPTLIAPQANADALALEPLSDDETDALLVHLETELPAPVRERIGAAAEGNPLFVEQMAAMAAERNGEGFVVPPSIHALLVQRLDRLSADERAVVQCAAVIGRDFSLPAVGSLSADEQRGSLSGHLLALVRKGFVRPDPGRPEPEDRFSFNHVLIRDTAYEAMPKELRAELHERLADWVEADTARELDEVVGYHLEQAYRARADIGPRDEHARSLAARAGILLGSAGRRALGRYDVPAAVALLERAAELLAEDPERRPPILIDLGLALRAGGRLEEADMMFAQAEEAVSEHVRCRAALERSSMRMFVDPSVEAEELLRVARAAADVFEAAGDDLGLARAWIHAAEAHWLRCRCAEMEEVLERALVHAERAGARREISSILGLMTPVALVGPRPVDDAIQRCIEIRDRGGGILAEAHANFVLAVLEAMEGRTQEARQLYVHTAQTLEDAGLMALLASLRMYPGMVELLAGDFEAAERELRLGYDGLAAVGHRAFLSTTAAFLAKPLYQLGRFDEAMGLTLASEEAASRDDIASQVIWRGTRAKVLARRGEAEAAERLAREAVDLSRETDLVNTRADALVDLAETMRLLGRDDEAAPALEEALQLYEAKGNVASAAAVRHT
jgi:class 3 adenylate cyclase/tetratricopeptide (TPR) repeat protein